MAKQNRNSVGGDWVLRIVGIRKFGSGRGGGKEVKTTIQSSGCSILVRESSAQAVGFPGSQNEHLGSIVGGVRMGGGVVDPDVHRFSHQIGGGVGVRDSNGAASRPRSVGGGERVPSDKIGVKKIQKRDLS